MPCPTCGFAVSATAKFCLECGTALARIPAAFQMVEQQVARLRAERTAGRIDADRYQAALRELMLHHEGRWWMVGADSGQWYVGGRPM
ncbi:MAG: hypothetical protein IPM01_28110, partial [Burkholderiaceae bacterium]|nr:hypothetical protein [Burkholderiaceae bacterium]